MVENNQSNQKIQKSSSGRGGSRKGAGRKKSALTVMTREVAEKIIKETPPDEAPLSIIVSVMRYFWKEAQEKMNSKNASEREIGIRLAKMTVDAATSAAPYMHPRLATVELTGKDGKDLMPGSGVLLVEKIKDEEGWQKEALKQGKQKA